MLVRVLKKRVPHVGVMGETKEIPDREARVLILLGFVEKVEEQENVEPKKPDRRYARRDMEAEEGGAVPRKRRAGRHAA